jgi:hypothetical protein
MAALIATEYARKPVAPTVSVAVTAKLDVAAVVGVPLITPVVAFNVTPVGRVPAVTANVFAPVPPVVDSVWLYAPPTVPPDKLTGLIATAALITSEYARDPVAPSPSVAETVKLNVPFAVAVPVKAPVDVSARPAGRAPALMLNVYVPLPPIAVID